MPTPTFSINERYKDKHIVEPGSVRVTKEYELNSSERLTEAQAVQKFYDFIQANGLSYYLTKPLRRLDVSVTEGSWDRQWTAVLEWVGESSDISENGYPRQPGPDQESFSSLGGTSRVTQAYSETRYGSSAPNMQGGIGWNGDQFEGIDIVSPTFEFSIAHKYPYDDVTTAVRNSWLALVGCVNSDTFAGFAAGEVLYCGFSGSSVTEYDGTLITIDGVVYEKALNFYNITHNFKCSPNVTGMNIAGQSVNKKGWEYLWVLREKYDDSTSGRTIEIPVGVYVNQVYRTAAFTGSF